MSPDTVQRIAKLIEESQERAVANSRPNYVDAWTVAKEIVRMVECRREVQVQIKEIDK